MPTDTRRRSSRRSLTCAVVVDENTRPDHHQARAVGPSCSERPPAKRPARRTVSSSPLTALPSAASAAVENGSLSTGARAVSSGDSSGELVRCALIKSGTAVDPQFPLASQCHVLCEHDEQARHVKSSAVWDCMLNQTNLQRNNNKFFLIQLLQHDVDRSLHVWMRWGRVGFNGQHAHTPCGSDMARAKHIFTKKFFDKTYNEWHSRHEFTKVDGKYDLILTDYSVDEPDLHSESRPQPALDPTPPESRLCEAVQSLIRHICDVTMMTASVTEMQYDAARAPLGKLTVDQIRAGYEALKTIDRLVRNNNNNDNNNNKQLVDACNDFYTRIPHCFGMRRPALISCTGEVRSKLRLLDTLGDIQLALTRLSSSAGDDQDDGDDDVSDHPVDVQYRRLKCHLQPLPSHHPDYQLIVRYIHTTHGHTHRQYRLRLEDVLCVQREGEQSRPRLPRPGQLKVASSGDISTRSTRRRSRARGSSGVTSSSPAHLPSPHRADHDEHKADDAGKDDNASVLLWHGSRCTNWAGILSGGLKIAPPEAPSTGYMFGKGIYLADVVSKSANYCWPDPTSRPRGILALCQVALGKSRRLTEADSEAGDDLVTCQGQVACHSVLGVGRHVPSNCAYTSDGVRVPLGPLVKAADDAADPSSLLYNEYVVYSVDQVKLRYLVRVSFDYE